MNKTFFNEAEEPLSAAEQDEPGGTARSFNNNSLWTDLLRQSLGQAQALAAKFDLPPEEMERVCAAYPALVNPYYLSLIKNKEDAIYKQAIPSIKELQDNTGQEDPLHEEPEHQVRQNVPPLLTHRYPDRVLFRVSNQCAMYCRFCTRKRKVGDINKQPTPQEIEDALQYLRNHEEIRDVILSGGDPLMLDDAALEKILKAVYEIINLRPLGIIRLGTRIPCVLPQRITENLCAVLKKYHPLFINTHFNHPQEVTAEAVKACTMLADAGIPLGCQTVLLKGVNDDPAVMRELMQKLLRMRVRPYYIYQADPVKGTDHFRTRVEKGLEIYRNLRGFTSGLAVPHYVIDAPGGGGKIPLLPEYFQEEKDGQIILKNYESKIFSYPQVQE